MALLRDIDERYSVEIVPVLPTPGGPRDAYAIACRRDGTMVLQRQYHVHRRQAGHSEMRSVARAFHYVHRLAGLTLPFSLGESGGPDYNEEPALWTGTPWMQVLMTSVRLSPADTSDTGVSVWWFFGSQRRPRRWPCHRVVVPTTCSFSAAAQFGQELWRELEEALHGRLALGLQAPADFADAELAPGGE